MISFFIKAKNIALDILFPPICLNCQKPIDDRNKLVCEKCLSLIKFNNTLFCPVCRARLPENKKICHCYIKAESRGSIQKLRFSYLLGAAGNYDDPILQNLIHYFKYKSFKGLAPILGEIVLKYFKNLFGNWDLGFGNFIIVPIPLYPKKERQRGFNQAKLIAEFLSKKLNLELIEPLKRIKNTEPQAKLKDQEKRLENILGCFKIENPGQIRGKNILLIDDVFTSGATINEAVKILKTNGALKIIALVLAKA